MICNKEDKMSSLEALKELKENAQEICKWELDRLNIIEKDLEILDIIKRKKVAIFIIPLCKTAYDYSMKTIGFERLTDKEFKLIKEWLNNK